RLLKSPRELMGTNPGHIPISHIGLQGIHQSSHQLTRLTRIAGLITGDGEAQFAYVADVAGGVGGAEGHRVVSGLGHGDLFGVRLPVAVVEDILEELHPRSEERRVGIEGRWKVAVRPQPTTTATIDSTLGSSF